MRGLTIVAAFGRGAANGFPEPYRQTSADPHERILCRGPIDASDTLLTPRAPCWGRGRFGCELWARRIWASK
jgi:hypothetical protein